MQENHHTKIEYATNKDLEDIKSWLSTEDREDWGSFFCNWNLIAKGQQDSQLLILRKQNEAVAFLLFGGLGPDILSVKFQERKKGYGAALYRHYEQFIAIESPILEIECTPDTSIPFWKKQGFILYDGNRPRGYTGKPHAYKIVRKSLDIEPNLQPVNIEFQLYERGAVGDRSKMPIEVRKPAAYYSSPNNIVFPERQVFYNPNALEMHEKPVISVIHNGQEIFRDKAREASILGLQNYDSFCFYLESLSLEPICH